MTDSDIYNASIRLHSRSGSLKAHGYCVVTTSKTMISELVIVFREGHAFPTLLYAEIVDVVKVV